MSFKIMHTADTHLCSMQYGVRHRAAQIFEVKKQTIRIAQQEGVNCIVDSGDVLDSSKNGAYVPQQLDEINNMLVERGIPMYTLTGNHDYDSPTWISKYGENTDRGIVDIDHKVIQLTPDIALHGIFTHNVKELFEKLAVIKASPMDIAVWHGGVYEFTGGGSYPKAKEILDASVIKRFALGDIHVSQYIVDGNSFIGYPGPIEMTDVNEDPNKYVTIFEFGDKGELIDFKKIKLETTPVITIQLVNDASPEVIAASVREAEKILTDSASTPRFVWFQYEEGLEKEIQYLQSFTTTSDVVRKKNLSVIRKKKTTDEYEAPSIVVNIEDISNELTSELPDDVKEAVMKVTNRTGTVQAVFEQLITKHEASFV